MIAAILALILLAVVLFTGAWLTLFALSIPLGLLGAAVSVMQGFKRAPRKTIVLDPNDYPRGSAMRAYARSTTC